MREEKKKKLKQATQVKCGRNRLEIVLKFISLFATRELVLMIYPFSSFAVASPPLINYPVPFRKAGSNLEAFWRGIFEPVCVEIAA